ncbi:MAG TPA: hypothetical protein VFT95_07770 [Micromonosporaceae bacterium]|nr:hypothetical protein [Micromonosporaceae bacterium]
MDFVTSALILAWLAILVLALAMAGLLHQVRALSSGRTVRATVGPPVGAEAPPLWPDGRSFAEVHTIALFLDPECESCVRSLRMADELAAVNNRDTRFVAVYRDGVGGHGASHVELLDHASEAFSRYRVPLTPFGVVIGKNRRIVGAAPLGSETSLRELVEVSLTKG